MKNIIRLILFSLLIASCNQIEKDNVAYRISEKDLIPEGIAYSLINNSFYVSSIYKTKIIQIDAETGVFKDFIPSDLFRMRYLGMIADETRNLLWACGNITKSDESYSSIAKFDLTTGELLKSYTYKDSVANTYNDIVYDENGNIYFTDSNEKSVYIIDKQLDSIDIFFNGIEITHPNGITISPDNKYLYIASTDNGIRVLDIKKRKIIGGADSTINSTGIDGLKYFNNSLYGIQNAVEEKSQVKIARYFLDESGTKIIKMEIIDQNNPLFDIPTTLVISANHLYCLANSQLWNISSPDSKIIDTEALKEVLILKYKLK
jgi:WD40 repeat protein